MRSAVGSGSLGLTRAGSLGLVSARLDRPSRVGRHEGRAAEVLLLLAVAGSSPATLKQRRMFSFSNIIRFIRAEFAKKRYTPQARASSSSLIH